MKAPLTVYVVHHPDCRPARKLATSLFHWFGLDGDEGDDGFGIPVWYRTVVAAVDTFTPPIRWNESELNVIVMLVDDHLVGDDVWVERMSELCAVSEGQAGRMILPVALSPSFYRLKRIYQGANPIRLLDMGEDQAELRLRRAVTEAVARRLRAGATQDTPPPLTLFLSHAKRDGVEIATALRDGVRGLGQLLAWYDENDLAQGHGWAQPMRKAAMNSAGLVAVVTDAYPTRPWCREEVHLARTPVKWGGVDGPSVWTIRPCVAVQKPGTAWSRDLTALAGVPRIGWQTAGPERSVADVVDRIALELLLGLVSLAIARQLAEEMKPTYRTEATAIVTWTPDPWTCLQVKKGNRDLRRIVFPGHGIPPAERQELKALLGDDLEFSTYAEVWP